MSVNVKQNGELVKIANNISVVQANWNETDTSKTSCIRNKPETLKTLQEINDNTDENALVSANAVKELADSIDGTSNIVYLTKADYEALPASKLTDGVEYRITDANTAARIAATDVTYGDSTVHDAISEVTESLGNLSDSIGVGDGENTVFQGSVMLENYSETNPYITPRAGMIRILGALNGSATIYAKFYNGSFGAILYTNNSDTTISMFVPKGLMVYGVKTGNCSVTFNSLISM